LVAPVVHVLEPTEAHRHRPDRALVALAVTLERREFEQRFVDERADDRALIDFVLLLPLSVAPNRQHELRNVERRNRAPDVEEDLIEIAPELARGLVTLTGIGRE